MSKKAYIYSITNTVSQKLYVGVTTRPKDRLWEHVQDPHSPLAADMARLGPDSFESQILETCAVENRIECESKWIGLLHPAYNQRGGSIRLSKLKPKYTTYGLQDGYTRDTFIIPIKFSNWIKEKAKSSTYTKKQITEQILKFYFNHEGWRELDSERA
jgi:group I intron endonuclease